MKNKMKKLAAMMLVGVAMCGSVLTTQAAINEGCLHTKVTPHISRSVSSYTHQFVKNNITYTCTVTVPHTRTIVTCDICGTTVSDRTTTGTESHSYPNH